MLTEAELNNIILFKNYVITHNFKYNEYFNLLLILNNHYFFHYLKIIQFDYSVSDDIAILFFSPRSIHLFSESWIRVSGRIYCV